MGFGGDVEWQQFLELGKKALWWQIHPVALGEKVVGSKRRGWGCIFMAGRAKGVPVEFS